MLLWSTRQQSTHVCVCGCVYFDMRYWCLYQKHRYITIFLLPPFIYYHHHHHQHCSFNIYYSISFQVSTSICINERIVCVCACHSILFLMVLKTWEYLSMDGLLEYISRVCCVSVVSLLHTRCEYGFVRVWYKPLYSISSYHKHQLWYMLHKW